MKECPWHKLRRGIHCMTSYEIVFLCRLFCMGQRNRRRELHQASTSTDFSSAINLDWLHLRFVILFSFWIKWPWFIKEFPFLFQELEQARVDFFRWLRHWMKFYWLCALYTRIFLVPWKHGATVYVGTTVSTTLVEEMEI